MSPSVPLAPRTSTLSALHAVQVPGGVGHVADEAGRQVLLRGVNVNSLGEYWQGNEHLPTLPFTEGDADVVADLGWNVVRLVVSWSRIEPDPGAYDDGYLDEVAALVSLLAERRVYTILDMHQDAWGPAVVARAGETFAGPLEPNLGWDGAPAWATFDDGRPHGFEGFRELSPAVFAAWEAFLTDRPVPGGVGIQTRFVAMWHHVARRFADTSAVAAFEILNEPNTFDPEADHRLAGMYERVFGAIRRGESEGRGISHLVMFEPSAVFSVVGAATPIVFAHDGNVASAPHIYTGTFPETAAPDEAWFANAAAEARRLGGLAVINGEWGGQPRSRDAIDADFYDAYQALNDDYGFGAQFWLYSSSCGDPHAIEHGGRQAGGCYVVDGATNRVIRPREDLMDMLARPYPRAVAGSGVTLALDHETRRFSCSYVPHSVSGATADEFSVPRRTYPAGYRVEIEGGAVTSESDSPVLGVRHDLGAESVRLIVEPNG